MFNLLVQTRTEEIIKKLNPWEKKVFKHLYKRIKNHMIWQNEEFRNAYLKVLSEKSAPFGKMTKDFKPDLGSADKGDQGENSWMWF